MLSKNTTRGARHGQPELNAARLRNAQQVKERDGRNKEGEEEGRMRGEREAERRNCSLSWRSSASPTHCLQTDDI